MDQGGTIRQHKLLVVLGLFVVVIAGGIIFFDVLLEKGANYAARKIQDDFNVRVSKVQTDFFSLKTSLQLDVKDKQSGLSVVDSGEVSFDVNFEGLAPLLDVRVSDTEIAVTKDLIARLTEKKAGQTQEAKKKSKTNYLSYLGNIELRNIDLSLSDESNTLFTNLLSLDLNFSEGKGSVKGIRTELREENLRLVEVDNIDVEFDAKGLLGEESAKIGVAVSKTRVQFAERAIEILKGLLKFPNQGEETAGPSPFKELSYIRLEDSRINLVDRNLAGFTDLVAVDFQNGTSEISDVRADWTHTGEKLVSLGKLTGKFSAEDLIHGNKPDLSFIITDFRLRVGKELLALLKSGEKKSEPAGPLDLPFTVSRILIGNSSISFPEYPGIGNQKSLAINEIFGNVKDLTFEEGTPLANFSINATFEGESKLMANGRLDLAQGPPRARVNYRLFDFDMTRLNPELREQIPLTFREGEFDLIGEVVMRDKNVVGYFKPFLIDASYMGNKKEFKNVRHFFAEVGATVTNWLFENSGTETVSTRVPFAYKNGSLDFKTGEAFWNAVEHGVLESDRVKPRTKDSELIQAQEEAKEK